MSFKVFVAAILLLFKVTIGQQLTLLQGPSNVSVSENDEAILECKFSDSASACVWSKDGEIIGVQEPYNYLGNPATGDCSIRISQVNLLRDDGLWRCQFPRIGAISAVQSQNAKVTVLVTPEEPTMLYNGEIVSTGNPLTIQNLTENATITCISKKGNPAAQLYWMVDNERREGNTRNESILNNEGLRLYNTESQLQLNNVFHLRGTLIKCIAEHPTFNGSLHESYGFFQVHHNTTQVNAAVEGTSSTNVAVNHDETLTLYCLADGIPAPNFIWSFQPRGDDKWEDRGNQQNLTVTPTAGTFICKAGNEYNIEYVKSFEEIQVEVKENKVIANNNGAFYNYLSMMVLVLTVSTSGINLFIF